MAEIVIDDQMFNILKKGGLKRIIQIGHSAGVVLPKYLFNQEYWKIDDNINMKILGDIIIIYNSNVKKRIEDHRKENEDLQEKLRGKW